MLDFTEKGTVEPIKRNETTEKGTVEITSRAGEMYDKRNV